MDIVVIDNFFDNFEEIENEFRKVKLYDIEEFKKNIGIGPEAYKRPINWPGFRSDALERLNPELFKIFNKTFTEKLPGHPMSTTPVRAGVHVHLRTEKDNKDDFIHTDVPTLYTCLVYLSESKSYSGTAFYDKENVVTKPNVNCLVGYKKNRLVIFDSTIPHCSIGNFGENKYNGRLTLNCFFHAV